MFSAIHLLRRDLPTYYLQVIRCYLPDDSPNAGNVVDEEVTTFVIPYILLL